MGAHFIQFFWGSEKSGRRGAELKRIIEWTMHKVFRISGIWRCYAHHFLFCDIKWRRRKLLFAPIYRSKMPKSNYDQYTVEKSVYKKKNSLREEHICSLLCWIRTYRWNSSKPVRRWQYINWCNWSLNFMWIGLLQIELNHFIPQKVQKFWFRCFALDKMHLLVSRSIFRCEKEK